MNRGVDRHKLPLRGLEDLCGQGGYLQVGAHIRPAEKTLQGVIAPLHLLDGLFRLPLGGPVFRHILAPLHLGQRRHGALNGSLYFNRPGLVGRAVLGKIRHLLFDAPHPHNARYNNRCSKNDDQKGIEAELDFYLHSYSL